MESGVESGAISLLDAQWIIDRAASNNPIQRRQELPHEAFVPLNEVQYDCVIALSYMWLHPHHPDPKGDTLRLLAVVLEFFTSADSYLDTGKPRRWTVLWDYASLHQHNIERGIYRTQQEDALFKEALDALSIFYAHPNTHVFRITEHPPNYPQGWQLPEGANIAEYHHRGWPFAESSLASLHKSSEKTLDLSKYDADYFVDYQKKTGMPISLERFDAVKELCSRDGGRTPPLSPEQFKEHLSLCSFTNGKVDLPLVTQMYRDIFLGNFCLTSRLAYGGLNWGDSGVAQLSEIVEAHMFPNLEGIELGGNDIGPLGCNSLAKALRSGNTPALKLLSLGPNLNIKDEGFKAIAGAIGSLECIECILLDHIGISDQSCQSLVEAILCNGETSSIKKIFLGHNNITSEGCRMLIPLTHCPNFELISIWDNPARISRLEPGGGLVPEVIDGRLGGIQYREGTFY